MLSPSQILHHGVRGILLMSSRNGAAWCADPRASHRSAPATASSTPALEDWIGPERGRGQVPCHRGSPPRAPRLRVAGSGVLLYRVAVGGARQPVVRQGGWRTRIRLTGTVRTCARERAREQRGAGLCHRGAARRVHGGSQVASLVPRIRVQASVRNDVTP